MADDQDKSQKTEQPTQKRLDDARQKGQVANSREVGSFLLFATAALLSVTVAPEAASKLKLLMRTFLAQAHALPTDPAGVGHVLMGALLDTILILALPFLGFIVAAIAASAVQNGIVVSLESMKPKWEKLSPLAGLKRLFSAKSMVEFLKNLGKLLLVSAAGAVVLWPERYRLLSVDQIEVGPMSVYLTGLCFRLFFAACIVMALLAGIDFAWQRFDYIKQMRMSRRDIQDEHKQMDGDPHIKGRLRQMRMERAQQRMMSDVPGATVVVTNPTHVSVALRYDPEKAPAPIVVAKGVDHLAMKIREVARANGVPLIESPPLARALNKGVEIGQPIPEQHYKTVAEIVGYVMRLRQG